MAKTFICMTILLSTLLILISCSPVQIKDEQAISDTIFCSDMKNTSQNVTCITEKYLTRETSAEINRNSIETFVSFDFSTEGASFFVIRDNYDNLAHISVDIFGEMGRETHSYIFAGRLIIYNVLEVAYSEPFFINPNNIPIQSVANRRYLILNGNVYRFIDETLHFSIADKDRNIIVERLIHFIETIDQNEYR